MGLDITAYSELKRVGDVRPGDDWSSDRLDVSPAILEWTEKEWPGRTAPIVSGCYEFSDSLKFSAGSYSGYNDWRDWLASLVGWKDAVDCWYHGTLGSPFYELINFADNEGVIGSVVALKLSHDFEHWHPKAQDGDHYDLERYNNWKSACNLAAQNGAIDFH